MVFLQVSSELQKKAFSVDFDVYPSLESSGKLSFQIVDVDKIETIMDAYGFDAKDTLALHINLPVVEDDCCKSAFLRGAW